MGLHNVTTFQVNSFATPICGATFVAMSDRRDDQGATRTVTRSEFLNDAGAVLRRAEREGPVVVTDERGAPRMEIHCPREKLAVSLD